MAFALMSYVNMWGDAMSKQLVCQYLENISRDALDKYQHLIRNLGTHTF